MISGEPGSGKTWVALAIATALSHGRNPFTGEKLMPYATLYASMEHDSSEVIHPRFAKLNGDLHARAPSTSRGAVGDTKAADAGT
jgi:RecA-family ATPase